MILQYILHHQAGFYWFRQKWKLNWPGRLPKKVNYNLVEKTLFFIHYLSLKRVETSYLLDMGKARAGFLWSWKYPNEDLWETLKRRCSRKVYSSENETVISKKLSWRNCRGLVLKSIAGVWTGVPKKENLISEFS